MAELGYSYGDLKKLLDARQASGARDQSPIESSTGEGGGTYISGYQDNGPTLSVPLPDGGVATYDPATDSFGIGQGDMDSGGIQGWRVGQQGTQNLGFEAPRSFGDKFQSALESAAPYLAGMAGLGIGATYLPALLSGGASQAGIGSLGGSTAGAAGSGMSLEAAIAALPSAGGGMTLAEATQALGGTVSNTDWLQNARQALGGTVSATDWLQNARQGLGALDKLRQGLGGGRGATSGAGGLGGLSGFGGGGGNTDTLAAPNMQNYNPTGQFADPYATAPVSRAPAQNYGLASLQQQFQEDQQAPQDEDQRFFAAGGMPGMGGIAPINYAKGGEYAAGGKYIRGPGDGMSDDVKANIDGAQEARLANSEFVLPADVVSHIGNGSSEAGAKKLYAMMDRIRHARTGNSKQGKQINPDKFLPA